MAATKAAVVTGTSSGIGAAVARALIDKDWRVLGVARRDAPLSHDAYVHLRFDLAAVDRSALAAAIAMHLAGASRVGLVNNAAAIGHLGTIRRMGAEELARVLAVNTVAPVWLMNEVLREASGTAVVRIVNVSTGAATGAHPGLGAYSISKAALRMAGKQFAAEWDAPESGAWRPTDASILSYEPGIVDTAMQTEARSKSVKDFPWDMFRGFKRDDLLVPPENPAAEIVEFLESHRQPSFSERRHPG